MGSITGQRIVRVPGQPVQGTRMAATRITENTTVSSYSARAVAGLLVGMSYGYWINKHSRHHDHPNTISLDPDIATGAIVFHEEAATDRGRLAGFILRRQGYLLFPLLLFLGFTLHVDSLRFLCGRNKVSHRWLKLAGITVRLGLYLGGAFAPNHKGMPIIPAGGRGDFLSRQVLTSRNISGGRLVQLLMGGLNSAASARSWTSPIRRPLS